MGPWLVRIKTCPKTRKIFEDQSNEICMKVDRSFAYLMGFQWVAMVMAVWLANVNQNHESLAAVFVLGGLFSLLPILCYRILPGRKVTRYITAMGQMLSSTLFVHLMGGQIGAQLLILISLAIISFYKDVGVLWLAGLIALADQVVRGAMFPYGVWIAIEIFILWFGIFKTSQVLWEIAEAKLELAQGKEKAQRKSILKSNFICNISHEMRTSLNSIIGFADILNETHLDKEQKEYANTIHRCSEELLVLINDVLDISKIENGLLELDRHHFDVHKLHEDVHKMFLVRCQEKGLRLAMDLDKDLPRMAVGDSHRIRQILINLVGNAVKFTNQGGVLVRVKKDQSCERIYQWDVQDTGIGIASENQQKLFKPFAQESASVSRTYGGSGLGLVISKNLIEMMGGKISLSSQLGKGSTFSFTLKLE